MKRVVLIVALVGCGGHVGPYEVTTDSGACTLYTPTSPGSDYCNVSACDAGSSEAGSDLTNTAIVKCGDSP